MRHLFFVAVLLVGLLAGCAQPATDQVRPAGAEPPLVVSTASNGTANAIAPPTNSTNASGPVGTVPPPKAVRFEGSLPQFVETCSWGNPVGGCNDLPPDAAFHNRFQVDTPARARLTKTTLTWSPTNSGTQSLGVRIYEANATKTIASAFGPSPLALDLSKFEALPGHTYVFHVYMGSTGLSGPTGGYVIVNPQEQGFVLTTTQEFLASGT